MQWPEAPRGQPDLKSSQTKRAPNRAQMRGAAETRRRRPRVLRVKDAGGSPQPKRRAQRVGQRRQNRRRGIPERANSWSRTSNGEAEGPHDHVGRATRAHTLFPRPRSHSDHASRTPPALVRRCRREAATAGRAVGVERRDSYESLVTPCSHSVSLRLNLHTRNSCGGVF